MKNRLLLSVLLLGGGLAANPPEIELTRKDLIELIEKTIHKKLIKAGLLFKGSRKKVTKQKKSVGTQTAPVALDVQSRYVYVVNETSGTLQIFDINISATPVVVGSLSVGTAPSYVYVEGHHAFITNKDDNTLQIVDVSKVSAPISVGLVATGSAPKAVRVKGRHAYVINNSGNSFQVFDISNYAAPFLVGSVATDAAPCSLYVEGCYAYVVNSADATLQIIDVSNPAQPVVVGSVATDALPRALDIQGGYAYVVSGDTANTLQAYNITDVTAPAFISSIATYTEPCAVSVQGFTAYVVAQGADRVQAFDVTDPASIGAIEEFITDDAPVALVVNGVFGYVVNKTANTLQMVDLGGAYLQATAAGSLEVASLHVRKDVTVRNDLDVAGGAFLGQGFAATASSSIITGTGASALIVTGTATYPVIELHAGSDAITSAPVFTNLSSTAVAGTAMHLDALNRMFLFTSSKRFKENIRPLGDASSTVYELDPVMFDPKKGHGQEMDQIGFIAEDVAKVNKGLVAYEADGITPRSVKYDCFHALTVGALQQQRRDLTDMRMTLNKLQQEIADLKKK